MSDTSVEVAETTEAAPTLAQKLGAEAIGTAILVFFGCGSVMASALSQGGSPDYAGVALAFGLSVVVGAYAFARISGAHFNPAISVGAALAGRLSWKDAGLYSAAQTVGGLIGGLLLALVMVTGDTTWDFGEPLASNGFGDHGGAALFGALLVEIITTLVFVMIVLAATDQRARPTAAFAPLVIGLSLSMIHLASIGFTGTSVNPARSIAVAFYSGGDAIGQLWLFIVAPLIGGLLAAVAYPALFGRDAEPVAGSGLNFGGGPAAGASAGVAAHQQWQHDQGQHHGQHQGQHHPDQQQWQHDQWAQQAQHGGWVQDERGQWVQAGSQQQWGQQHGQQQGHQQWGQQQDQWGQQEQQWQAGQGGQGGQWDQGAQQAAGSGEHQWDRAADPHSEQAQQEQQQWGQHQWQPPGDHADSGDRADRSGEHDEPSDSTQIRPPSDQQ